MAEEEEAESDETEEDVLRDRSTTTSPGARRLIGVGVHTPPHPAGVGVVQA
jgi:hypothetical protein